MLDQLSRATQVIVQGATGRMARVHIENMLAYGTRIVAGVSTRAEPGQAGVVPLFRTCREAVAATGSRVSLVMMPADAVMPAVEEALASGIRIVVTVAEGLPVHDALRIRRLAKEAGAQWLGASTPGLAIPGEMKIGFLPNVSLRPGPLGIMAKSGTLSYEVGFRLVMAGLGQSIWIGVGGDMVKGTRFRDLLPLFHNDHRTRGILLIGEVGGDEEEEFAWALAQSSAAKPVYALVAGSNAKEGVSMGHAGALVFGAVGTYASKKKALEAAGAKVFTSVNDLIDACRRDYVGK